jgi:hypothetical protein
MRPSGGMESCGRSAAFWALIHRSRGRFHRYAIAPAGFEALFALARVDHRIDQPDAPANEKDSTDQKHDIGRAPFALVFLVVSRLPVGHDRDDVRKLTASGPPLVL